MRTQNHLLLVAALGIFTGQAYAQSRLYSNTALQFSDITQSGSARFQGVGGNHASLGGDASNIAGNPAGLGFFNKSEISLSPTLYSISNKSSYIGSSNTDQKLNPNLSQFSLILAGNPQSYNREWRRTSFGINYSRQVNLNNMVTYGGTNNRSSMIDDIVEVAGTTPVNTLENDYNNGSPYSIESAFYNLYLIDALSSNGPYRRPIPLSRSSFQQTGNLETSGASSQWTFAYAGNYADKLYLGISGGFSRHSYIRRHNYQEQFVNSGPFRSLDYREDININGSGIFLSAGVIYRANPFLQLGASIHSPTWSSMRMTYEEELGVNVTNNSVPVYDSNGNPVTNSQGQQAYDQLPTSRVNILPFDFEYSMRTPLRADGGATFFFGKKGFLTASAEYVGYKGMSVRTGDDNQFKTNNRRLIQSSFNNVVNLRVGGEARIDFFRVRAGVAFLPNPYSQNYNVEGKLDRSKFQFSGGAGYRNDRFYIDLAGTYLQTKDAFVPYQLNDPSNYFSAKLNVSQVNVTGTVGLFF
ncbi:hypothetical protein P1X15_29345 [Runella sp. MFBS21]|uniref:OmpP1/FadL family transporter n=1 Tax=Runella sp. MFBS21 TaxID=3034018 RepID=UPI0023F9C870|nr:hypothetical protein [Runella sp. MFBS21]MDF7821759.1 hypothetical protein [Runella sp. MFBS21]